MPIARGIVEKKLWWPLADPYQPIKEDLSPGLEWSVGNLRYHYLSQEDVTVPAGTFRRAYLVDCFHTVGSYSTLVYYVDGIGEVKSGEETELLEFKPGGS